ncbi:hypothetical protein BKP45_05700 [Anaerobacillus alkalidiazotrophicus]|uniref:DUF1189 domain-containing protein n=1 Tax=Anaerobacillus alkalidiazotrophicus TaxID=472963 RepID=A0A1S2MBL7_9BACI|nr:DUF1189 domain-containing protein [Anaerobacillus alkalidiazotrophicus]OIJ22168.1 hypothetical protein BKP45_05700 [Anaerobacillus alkalidiazotrophicus]
MNIFQQFFKSIYSPQTVAKFRNQGIGKTILYVFVLMLISVSVSAIQLGTGISNTVNNFQVALKTDIPDFELKNSVLTSELEEPLFITIDGEQFIFDTTGSLTIRDIEQNYTHVLALLETEAVFITEGITESFRYREFGNLNFTKEQVEEITSSVINLLPLIIAVVVLILYFFLTAMKFIGVFFLSFIALLIRKKLDLILPYKKVWILSAYAVTLPTIFFAITDALYIFIPFSFTLYWVVAIIMIYLIFKEISTIHEDNEPEQL